MEEVGKVTGLVKRGNVYYHRVRIPKDLVEVFGRKEVWTSLRTNDYATAANLAKVQQGIWSAAFLEKGDEIRMAPSRQHSERNLQAKTERPLSEEDTVRLAQRWFAREYRKLENTPPTQLDYDDPKRSEYHDELFFGATILDDLEDPNNLISIQSSMRQLMEEAGISENAQPDLFWVLHENLRKAMREIAIKALADFENDRLHEVAPGLFREVAENPSAYIDDRMTFSAVLDRFWLEKVERKSHSPKTIKKYRAAIGLMTEWFGSETSISSINRTRCNQYRDFVGQLPPRFALRYPDLSALEIVETVVTEDSPRMSYETQYYYVSAMTRVLRWARREGLTDVDAEEIYPLVKRTAGEDSRDPFSRDQLKAIFDAPLFTGCVDDERSFAKAGPNHPRRSRFWVPLIALYTGMRMGEILQLSPEDVKSSPKGTPFIHIHRDDGRRLKTMNAVREVPVHPELTKIGFVIFAENQRKDGLEMLFPDVPEGSDGYQSSTFSKRFETFLRSCGAHDDRTSFHSFRHNFRDALREANVSEEKAEQLCGWSRGKKDSRRYGRGHTADALYDDVCKVEYEELDLSHIHAPVLIKE